MDYCDSSWRVVSPEKDTIPEALAAMAPYVHARGREKFVVALGDCLFDGRFTQGLKEYDDAAIGTMQSDCDFGRSYAVEVGSMNVAHSTIEKPHMGLGCYWFNFSVFDHFAYCRGITEVIQRIMDTSGIVSAIPFEGNYLNATYPSDLDRWA